MIRAWPIPGPLAGADNSGLMVRAIAGVLRNAQDGELPLFAWTLGLPQPVLAALVAHCFPELGALESMPQQQYAAIAATAPVEFRDLAVMLLANRSVTADLQHAAWLAHAIAAASLGSRHLWQDLGLTGRDALSRLLAQYFAPLYRRNTHNLKWKRFLFAELGALQGRHHLQPPKCHHYAEFPVCFPVSDQTGKTNGNQR
ncbi:nitrogen fixation protein NifQ [Herminiimonas sp. CN]|uniref:nitrogen fixation protein NifQ n=1 Tax=Herminiimonas sp. CN TaxID=1349818 RepID=UPI00047428D4|nr:nitrogen fixation protein NifQ [Herminiimonas sp. CN]